MVLDDFRRVHHHGRRCWADRRTLGTYRVVYRIDDAAHTVYVLSVRLRGDVYGVR